MKKQIKRFTLVEILMVTGMICLIAALIVVAYNGVYRSWSSKNTVATMKAAHLALDRYMLENNTYPVQSWNSGTGGYLRFAANSSDPAIAKLAADLLQAGAPYSYERSNTVTLYDDFGPKPPGNYHALYYVFPYGNTNSFAIMSMGKNGEWGGDDDIIYLPVGDRNHNLKSGFYLCSIEDSNGDIENYGELEPLAQ
ncbi:MAG: type II secretion system protein [Lentisphaerae bacterium]|nr:type II secretion system protein [Lentisphaerota bacterium]